MMTSIFCPGLGGTTEPFPIGCDVVVSGLHTGATIDDRLDLIQSACEQIEGNVGLVGHSLGGALILALCKRGLPQNVQKLVLIDNPWGFDRLWTAVDIADWKRTGWDRNGYPWSWYDSFLKWKPISICDIRQVPHQPQEVMFIGFSENENTRYFLKTSTTLKVLSKPDLGHSGYDRYGNYSKEVVEGIHDFLGA